MKNSDDINCCMVQRHIGVDNKKKKLKAHFWAIFRQYQWFGFVFFKADCHEIQLFNPPSDQLLLPATSGHTYMLAVQRDANHVKQMSTMRFAGFARANLHSDSILNRRGPCVWGTLFYDIHLTLIWHMD